MLRVFRARCVALSGSGGLTAACIRGSQSPLGTGFQTSLCACWDWACLWGLHLPSFRKSLAATRILTLELSGQGVRHQLYTEEDDRNIYTAVQEQLKAINKRLQGGRVALQHLEMFLVNVACNDPGGVISAHRVLPLLRERLHGRAWEFAAERIREAEQAVLKVKVGSVYLKVKVGSGY